MAYFLNVEVQFLSSEKGGRKHLPDLNENIYRPHFRVFSGPNYLGIEFSKASIPVAFDIPILATVLLLYYGSVDYRLLTPEAQFEILEGSKIVGYGKVIGMVTESHIFGLG